MRIRPRTQHASTLPTPTGLIKFNVVLKQSLWWANFRRKSTKRCFCKEEWFIAEKTQRKFRVMHLKRDAELTNMVFEPLSVNIQYKQGNYTLIEFYHKT